MLAIITVVKRRLLKSTLKDKVDFNSQVYKQLKIQSLIYLNEYSKVFNFIKKIKSPLCPKENIKT